jgi:hypothetical protein
VDFALFSLKIAASRTVKLGGTVATVGFPDIGLQGFAPKLAGFNAKAQRGKGAKYKQCLACVLATLRLCVKFLQRALVDARGNVVGIVAAKLDASAALAATGSLPESLRTATK